MLIPDSGNSCLIPFLEFSRSIDQQILEKVNISNAERLRDAVCSPVKERWPGRTPGSMANFDGIIQPNMVQCGSPVVAGDANLIL